MKVIYSLTDLPELDTVYLTIGNFDGLHLGHRKIIQTLLEEAKGKTSVVITFEKAPLEFLNSRHFKGYLFPSCVKQIFLEQMGIDFMVSLHFPDVMDIPAHKFLSLIFERVKEPHLFVGHDFKFGKNNSGSIHFLRKEAARLNFSVKEIEKITIHNTTICSSLIREKIQEGKMEEASLMLGRYYFISFFIEKGDGIGKTIGFPTINLKINEQVLPEKGVYFTLYRLGNKIFPAMTYIGNRPVLNGTQMRHETHIINLEGNEDQVKREEIQTIFFVKKIRDEKKFHNLEELRKNLYNDKEFILRLFEKEKDSLILEENRYDLKKNG
jgi:riboflavin kinase/FMN adenylyltransferase